MKGEAFLAICVGCFTREFDYIITARFPINMVFAALCFPQTEPWLKHLFPEYCFLYLHQRCHFKYTVYVSLYVEELFALAEKTTTKNGA